MEQRSIPRLVVLLFVFDASLVAIYLVDHWLGAPLMKHTHQHDLNGEANFPAWFSSAKYLTSSILFWFCIHGRLHLREPRTWLLAFFPLMLLGFSCDEVAQIHESLGRHADILVLPVAREHSAFKNTGVWTIVIGAPAILVILVGLIAMGRHTFRRGPVLTRFVLGLAIMLTGSVGLETLSNFLPDHGGFYEIALEEYLEMLGATLMLWAAFEQARMNFDEMLANSSSTGSENPHQR